MWGGGKVVYATKFSYIVQEREKRGQGREERERKIAIALSPFSFLLFRIFLIMGRHVLSLLKIM